MDTTIINLNWDIENLKREKILAIQDKES